MSHILVDISSERDLIGKVPHSGNVYNVVRMYTKISIYVKDVITQLRSLLLNSPFQDLFRIQ